MVTEVVVCEELEVLTVQYVKNWRSLQCIEVGTEEMITT